MRLGRFGQGHVEVHPALMPFAMHGHQATVAGDRVIVRLVGLAVHELRYIETAPLSRERDADGRVWDVAAHVFGGHLHLLSDAFVPDRPCHGGMTPANAKIGEEQAVTGEVNSCSWSGTRADGVHYGCIAHRWLRQVQLYDDPRATGSGLHGGSADQEGQEEKGRSTHDVAPYTCGVEAFGQRTTHSRFGSRRKRTS